MDARSRREKYAAEIKRQTGVDDALIEGLVRAFYQRVREDAILGPIFENHITDWEPHLNRMCAFWSSVALMSGQYHGRPMESHLNLPVDSVHFDRWLLLFEETARNLCSPPAANHFVERANRIARSLELGIATYKGVILSKNERYLDDSLASADGV